MQLLPSVVRKSGFSSIVHEKGGLSVYAASQILSNELSQSVEVKFTATAARAGQLKMVAVSILLPSDKNTPAHDCGTENYSFFW